MYAERKCTSRKQRQYHALELATEDYIRTVETGGGRCFPVLYETLMPTVPCLLDEHAENDTVVRD
jgi:hypothetical protein